MVRHEPQQLVGDAAAVERLHRSVVQVLQHGGLAHVEILQGTDTKVGKLAYAMSTSNPRNTSFNSGTTASGTATILSVPGWCFMTS